MIFELPVVKCVWLFSMIYPWFNRIFNLIFSKENQACVMVNCLIVVFVNSCIETTAPKIIPQVHQQNPGLHESLQTNLQLREGWTNRKRFNRLHHVMSVTPCYTRSMRHCQLLVLITNNTLFDRAKWTFCLWSSFKHELFDFHPY